MKKHVTVNLETPIDIGGSNASAIDLRRPTAGELRGVNLLDIARMETAAVCTVLTRISTPKISQAEAALLDPVDLFTIAVEIATFLEPKAAQSLPT